MGFAPGVLISSISTALYPRSLWPSSHPLFKDISYPERAGVDFICGFTKEGHRIGIGPDWDRVYIDGIGGFYIGLA